MLRVVLYLCVGVTAALSSPPPCSHELDRRQILFSTAAVGLAGSPNVATASGETFSSNGLGARLAKRDASVLKNSVFNVPPAPQVYPPFLRGAWKVSSRFRGYLFPSERISKERLTQDVSVPGFQKCSIAAICDVGKEEASYVMKIDAKSGLEDRVSTLAQQIDAYLGYKAVSEVIYDARANPNRLSIDFVDYKTKNAERIELFCNARESELYERDGVPFFVCSEFVRQVTFSGGPDVGVARQVGGNYAHFWTWKKTADDRLDGNLLTAVYLDPQDPLFFDEPSKPVAVYSHSLQATRAL